MKNGNIIEEVKNNTDIVSLIGTYIDLNKRGKNYFGVCPFHDDTNPSLSVSPDKGIYKCFSCGASGNVFNFLMDYKHITFGEALKILADKAGIEGNFKYSKKETKYDKYYEAYDLANKFYKNNLLSKVGTEALNYLHDRKITDELINYFDIGLSLSGNKLKSLLESSSFNLIDMENIGLLNNGNDFFNNRIIFPIKNLNGDVVAFSGRLFNTKDKTSKYINTKETVIFNKSDTLYNYSNAKMSRMIRNYVIITEGFMDVIRLHSIGIDNAIATMGTALTKDHVNEIRKLNKNVLICFDGDKAGNLATINNGEILEKSGFNIKVINLKDDEDPDSFIIKEGKDSFLNLIKNAIPYTTFCMNYYEKELDTNDLKAVSTYINKILNNLSKENDDVLSDMVISNLSSKYNVSKETLNIKLSNLKNKDTVKPIIKSATTKPKAISNKYEIASKDIIMAMLSNNKLIDIYNNNPVYLINDTYQEILNEILYHYKFYDEVKESDIFTKLIDNKTSSDLFSKMIDTNKTYSELYFKDCLIVMEEYEKKERIKELSRGLKGETDPKLKAELLEEMRLLKKDK